MTMRYAGLALIVGVVVAFIAPLFIPGYVFIDQVDQTDYAEALGAFADAPVLAQWMTFLTLISLLLMSFAFVCLYPLARRQAGLGGRLLQFGIIATIIEWSILIIATGMRHFELHLLQRAEIAAAGSQAAADFEAAALALHLDTTGVNLAFIALAPIASSLFGLGLAKRFSSMSPYKIACYVLPVSGLVGLINFLFAISAPDTGIDALLFVNTIVLYIQGLCLIAIGYGMYQGREELATEDSSG